ncbi:MAG: hypothetical protein KDJ52_35140 [Anaerolineae bacterium]|nr:hypothetical protein [Anaerolineae bacterium]
MQDSIKEALDEICTPFFDARKDNAKETELVHIICTSVVDFVRDVSTKIAANPEKKTRVYQEDVVRERTANLLKELVLETIKDLESQQ